MSDNFHNRTWVHDNIAVPAMEEDFLSAGYKSFVSGIEFDDPELKQMLRNQQDLTSMRIRYKPDRILVHPKDGSLMCEIKSESQGYNNFAIEFNSYAMVIEWGKMNKILYAFANINETRNCKMTYTWAENIKLPSTVIVPNRSDANVNKQWIKKKFPTILIKHVQHRGGSGTPYFLVPKNASYMLNFALIFPKSQKQLPEQLKMFE